MQRLIWIWLLCYGSLQPVYANNPATILSLPLGQQRLFDQAVTVLKSLDGIETRSAQEQQTLRKAALDTLTGALAYDLPISIIDPRLDQHTLLSLALAMQQKPIIELLLTKANPDTLQSPQRSLFYAARLGDLAILNRIISLTGIEKGRVLATYSAATQCELDPAIEGGHLAVVKRLYPLRKANCPALPLLLRQAIIAKQLPIFEWLVTQSESATDLTETFTQQSEWQSLASATGDVAWLDKLAALGVDFTTDNGAMTTAIGLKQHSLAMVKRLVALGNTVVLPETAVRYGNVEILRYYQQRGIELDPVWAALPSNVEGFTERDDLLLTAVRSGQLAVIQLLQAAGSVLDKPQTCPLLTVEAAKNGYIDILAYLLEQKQPFRSPCDDNATPLKAAVAADQVYLVAEILYGQRFAKAPLALLDEGVLNIAAENLNGRMINMVANAINVDGIDQYGNTALHALIRHQNENDEDLGSRASLLHLLQLGADVNRQNDNGDTPLMLAVSKGDLFTVAELVNRGAQVNLSNNNGNSALHFALSSMKSKEVLAVLLLANADVSLRNQDGYSMLHYAVAWDELPQDDSFAKGKDSFIQNMTIPPFLDWQTEEGETALMLAIKQNSAFWITWLLEKGANIQLADQRGNTALHYAALLGNQEVIQGLTKAGADVNARNKEGNSALFLAQDRETTSTLLAQGASATVVNEAGESPLTILTQNAEKRISTEQLKLLLNANPQLNQQNTLGQSALHLAIKYHALDAIDILLKGGINAGLMDNEGNTALHYAVRSRSLAPLRLLLNYPEKVKLDFPNQYGLTALQLAVALGQEKAFQLLIEAKASIHTKDQDQRTPLHTALSNPNSSAGLVQPLIRAGADVNARTRGEWTPLHFAARYGNEEQVKALLDAGADPYVLSWGKETALDIAKKYQQAAIVKRLESITQAHSNPVATDKNPYGRTTLHLAIRAGDIDGVKEALDAKADVNARTIYGETPLLLAVRLAQSDQKIAQSMVGLLLAAGAEVNARTSQGESLLQHAINRFADSQIIQQLIAHKAELAVTDAYGKPLFISAIERGDLATVNALLQANADLLLLKDKQQRNALQLAVKYNHTELALNLLSRGMSPNIAQVASDPLAEALSQQNLIIANALLEAGAKLQQSATDTTLLTQALNKNQHPIAWWLLQSGYDLQALSSEDSYRLLEKVAMLGNAYLDVVKYFFEQYDFKRKVKNAAPIRASLVQDAEQLLAYFSSLGMEWDRTAPWIIWATEKNAPRSLRYFQQQGLALDSLNDQGENALFVAVRHQAVEALEWLIQQGLNTQQINQNGENVLYQLAKLSSSARLANNDYLAKSKKIITLLPMQNYSYIVYKIVENQQYDLARLLISMRQVNLNQLLDNPFSKNEMRSLWSAFAWQQMGLAKERLKFAEYLIKEGLGFQFTLPTDKKLTPYFTSLGYDFALLELLLKNGYQPSIEEVRVVLQSLIQDDTKGLGMGLLKTLLKQGALVDEQVLRYFASRYWSEIDIHAKVVEKYTLLLKHFTPTEKINLNENEAAQQDLPVLIYLLSNQSLCNRYSDIILQQLTVKNSPEQFLLPILYRDNPLQLDCLGKPNILKALLAQSELKPVLSQHLVQLLLPSIYSVADLRKLFPILLSSGLTLQNNNTKKTNLAHWLAVKFTKSEEIITGLDYLAELGVDLTQENAAGDNLLHTFFRQADNVQDGFRLLDFLIRAGLKADAVGANQETLLHIIINNKKLDAEQRLLLIKRLLASKPHLNVQDRDGNTPLHRAIMQNQWPVVEILITKAGLIGNEVLNQQRESPLHLLIGQNQLALSLRLLAVTNDVNQADEAGDTLLLRLSQTNCQADCSKLAQSLLDKGANLQQQNKAGENALTLATYQGNTELATFLISKGIALDHQNRYGDSAAHIALSNSAAILDILIQQGANLARANWQDKTVRAALEAKEAAAHAAVASLRYPDWDWPESIQQQWLNEALLFHVLGEKRFIAAQALLTLNEPDFYRDPLSNDTLLHQAARNNLSELVSTLLPSRYQLDMLNNRGDTALHIAIKAQAQQTVEILLALGANANKRNGDNENALQIAINSRNTALALLVLNSETNFDFSQTDSQSRTAVQAAIHNNDLVLLKALAERGANIRSHALLLAIEQGNVAMVRWIIEQGVDVNEPSSLRHLQQRTPLLHAVWYYVTQSDKQDRALLGQYIAIIKLLLANKADINALDKQGRNALYIGMPVYEIAQLLLSEGANVVQADKRGEAPFFQAVRSTYPQQNGEQFLQSLVDAGAKFTVRNADQETPLQSAIRHNNAVAIRFLLKKGVDVNVVKSDTQFTLAMYVISSFEVREERKLPLLKQLKAAGADLNYLNINQENVLFLALRQYLPKTDGEKEWQWLLQQSISVTQVNRHFETLGHVLLNTSAASEHKTLQWLDILIKAGLDINALDASNQNLLHLAIKRRKLFLIPRLLTAQTDLNEQDLQGFSALHLLVNQLGENELDLALIKRLLMAGANPNLRDRRGETVLHLAYRYAQTELITLLTELGADATIRNYQGQRPAETGQQAINY